MAPVRARAGLSAGLSLFPKCLLGLVPPQHSGSARRAGWALLTPSSPQKDPDHSSLTPCHTAEIGPFVSSLPAAGCG